MKELENSGRTTVRRRYSLANILNGPRRSQYASNQELYSMGIHGCGEMDLWRGKFVAEVEVDPTRRKLGRLYPDRFVTVEGETIMRPVQAPENVERILHEPQ